MMLVAKVVVFLVIVHVTSSLQPHIRLVKSCISRYKKTGGSFVDVEVKNSTGDACEGIPAFSKRKGIQIVNALTTSMAVGSYGDINVLNISLKVTAKDKKLPKFILLELTKYVEKGDAYFTTEHVCVLLSVGDHDGPGVPPTLFFDCVQLLAERNAYLGVKVWCLSSQTRRKRSLPTSKKCNNVSGKMVCSEDNLFPLSIEEHIPAICHCSDYPNISLERLANGSFQLDARNLPQYAYKVTFEIKRWESRKLVYSKTTAGTERAKEARRVITEKAFGPGNYTLVVSAECAGTTEDILRSGRYCSKMGSVELENPLEVPYPFTTLPPTFQPAVHTFLPVGAAVISSGLVAVVVFLLRRRWNNRSSGCAPSVLLGCAIPEKEQNIPLRTSNNNSAMDAMSVLSLASRKPEKMLIYHPDDRFHVDCVWALQNLCQQFEVSLVTGTDSYGVMKQDTKFYMTNRVSNSREIDVEDEVETICELCGNWRDFAEAAGTKYSEIVILMSEGLFQICETFWNKSSKKDVLDTLMKERQYEIIPCVVLQKVQRLVQENPEADDFSVHFISFDSNTDLIHRFLNTFNFLKRCRYDVYYICQSNLNTDNDRTSGRLSIVELKRLLRRLKGLRENENEYTAINTKISHQNLWAELSRAIFQRQLYLDISICETSL